MDTKYKIYLICYYEGRPIDFLLPIYTENQFANVLESAGTCFKIQNTHGAEIILACRKNDTLVITRVNVENAIKTNSNISFSIIINEDKKTAFLRTFTDNEHNGLLPLPFEFIEQARTH